MEAAIRRTSARCDTAEPTRSNSPSWSTRRSFACSAFGDELARSFKLPQPSGYLVSRVMAGSDADALGLKGGAQPETVAGEDVVIGGDVVLKAMGIQVAQPADLPRIRTAFAGVAPGQEVSVTVLRGGGCRTSRAAAPSSGAQ